MEAKFSPRVKDVISYSREEALRLGNDFIGTEHLLLGVIREGDNTAVKILKNMNVDLQELRKEVEMAVKDRTGKNIANINNVSPTSEAAFQERFVNVASRVGADGVGDGAVVTGVQFGDPDGRVVYDPNHPYADAAGMVRLPDVDLSEQMVYMQLAQRGYQANVRSFESAKEAYESLLSIGK